MSKYISHFINGKLVEGSKNSMSGVFNPATGEEISKVFLATSKEVDQAVAAATAAWPAWSATPALQRSRVLFRFKTILEANLDKLAAVVSEEHGKTISDAKGSCMRGLEVVEFACGIPHLLKGEFSENIGKGIDSWSTRQALGVCAGITPFNFPVMIALWMFPLSIACGNCFILKPSERDPSAALLLAGWMKEAGLPDGVLNVVQGDKNTVDLLLGHPGHRRHQLRRFNNCCPTYLHQSFQQFQTGTSLRRSQESHAGHARCGFGYDD
jgi:malonate-semialdehyde dehydrogenase (acetylating)/methylmalonate-semialdehyde dehydrogenase